MQQDVLIDMIFFTIKDVKLPVSVLINLQVIKLPLLHFPASMFARPISNQYITIEKMASNFALQCEVLSAIAEELRAAAHSVLDASANHQHLLQSNPEIID